ncbi:hypothetical protein FHS15_005735 [Paenibacillus castaneae]|uniref:hypothetical protein n=1 Tax=Paenibacillus TaxID=44249 RepID=UPI00112335EA|nr:MULTISPECIES: hypothetical protein [Paenibacillus]NIK80545.1 hypothetical protein [Paenibacillus castaneae]
MARKNRSIAGFEDVANVVKENVNVNVNDNILVEEDDKKRTERAEEKEDIQERFLDRVIEGNLKKNNLVLVGVYLEPQIAEILDRLGKKAGRGAKSRIVNDALRGDFGKRGLLK